MISKKSPSKISAEDYKRMASYFGIAVQVHSVETTDPLRLNFADIEVFFLSSTLHLKTSRITEGFLCWLLEFGRFLSPSKIRRHIQAGCPHDSAVLGGLIEFLIENNVMPSQWRIVTVYCRKKRKAEQLLDGPIPREPSSYFAKYGILAPRFRLEGEKFLMPKKAVYQNCIELRNRALFGSIVNADVASYLKKHPTSGAYQIAKNTNHHKARVFAVYENILAAS